LIRNSADYKQQVIALDVTNRIAAGKPPLPITGFKYVGLERSHLWGMTTLCHRHAAGELFKEFGLRRLTPCWT